MKPLPRKPPLALFLGTLLGFAGSSVLLDVDAVKFRKVIQEAGRAVVKRSLSSPAERATGNAALGDEDTVGVLEVILTKSLHGMSY
jgi:hypothetical protein